MGSHSVLGPRGGTPFATCSQVFDLGRAVDLGIEPLATRSHVVKRPIDAHLDFRCKRGESVGASSVGIRCCAAHGLSNGRFNRRSRDVGRFGVSVSVLSLVIARERSETGIVGKLSRDIDDPDQRELEFHMFRGRAESAASDPPHGIVDLNPVLHGAEIGPNDRRWMTSFGGRAHLLQAFRAVDLVGGRAASDLDFRRCRRRAFEVRAAELHRKNRQHSAYENHTY